MVLYLPVHVQLYSLLSVNQLSDIQNKSFYLELQYRTITSSKVLQSYQIMAQRQHASKDKHDPDQEYSD